MRLKSVLRLCPQPARLACQDSISYDLERSLHLSYPDYRNCYGINSHGISQSQQGASTLVLALFVVAILVTAVVGLLFGHKLGYQRGY